MLKCAVNRQNFNKINLLVTSRKYFAPVSAHSCVVSLVSGTELKIMFSRVYNKIRI